MVVFAALGLMAKRVQKRVSPRIVAAPPPVDSRQLALDIAAHLKGPAPAETPTLLEFVPRFFREHVRANRHKNSGEGDKLGILKVHLLPRFGHVRLADITADKIQALKGDLAHLSAKRVNNILTVLNKMLGTAEKWGVMLRAPRVEFLKTAQGEAEFYEFDEYAALVAAARAIDVMHHLATLLAGDAGLRAGELMAFRAHDVDHRRQQLHVRRADSHGVVSLPKGGKPRTVPMTQALSDALGHVSGKGEELVLRRDDGSAVTQQTLRTWLTHVQAGAGMGGSGKLHILRHTFCSHLAMRGAPPIAIKELAGHQSLRTTMRYMHLAPSEKNRAIRLLDEGRALTHGGLPLAPSDSEMSPAGIEPAASEPGRPIRTLRDDARNRSASASRGADILTETIEDALRRAKKDGGES